MNDLFKKIKLYGPLKAGRFALVETYRLVFFNLMRHSYSQKGEDLVIDKLLGRPKNGFYVDVGAHDPDRFSNTRRFYERGWHGINIEPNLDLFVRFSKRKRDINLNCGISGEDSEGLVFYRFFPDTLSTFDPIVAQGYKKQGFKCTAEKKVAVKTLTAVFENYVHKTPIDFLNVDVEGLEMEVLRGNDWERFRPRLICIEATACDAGKKSAAGQPAWQHRFLQSIGYQQVYTNDINAIYKDQRTT